MHLIFKNRVLATSLKTRTMNNKFTFPYFALTLLFCVCLIIANLVEIKTVDLGWFTITAGFIVFPVSYIINDCIVEIYGFRKARLAIWAGFAASVLVSLMLQIAIWLPGGSNWNSQDAMVTIYGAVPRIMAASFIAFICGSMVNAMIMSMMKRKHGRSRFSLRAILSTLFGEGTDSIVFFPIAFAGILPTSTIVSLIVTQTLLKTLYEILVLPVTMRVVKTLRKYEHDADVTDSADVSYKWWKINDIG